MAAPAPAVDKTPRATASGGQTPGGFALLESSWRSMDKAGHRAAELRARGQAAFDAAADLGDKGVWHRVLVGPFPTAAEAKAYRETLPPDQGLAAAKILPLPADEAPTN
jgi:cell division septation protein DedD